MCFLFSFKEVPSIRMATSNGPWRIISTAQRTLRRRLLPCTSQWPHSLQCPQQSQPWCCSEGYIYIYMLLPLYHVHVSLQAKLCWTIFMCSILIIKNLTNKLFQVRDGFFFLTISFMLILIYACMEFKMFS